MSKKLIYGVGFNSGGKHNARDGRKTNIVYSTWYSMMKRCYLPSYQLENPTYVGCSITHEWHDFQKFADWYFKDPYSELGYDLDKDILFVGNKIYCPSRCSFIPQELNKILNKGSSKHRALPQGVTFKKEKRKYRAEVSINSKNRHLGYFNYPNEAFQVYRQAKEAYVKEKALQWQDRIADNVFQALMNWQLTE